MLNPFFVQGTKSEQGLIQDLINEQLKMYGVEVYYLPRSFATEKTVMKEVIESNFDSAYPIEAYVNTYEGYSDNPTLLSKFGIQSLNEITLVISRERFENYITPLTAGKANLKLTSRPKEGDLIYFPLGERLFEIKYVEHEKPFYQLQGLYTYELRCELFQYEDELINTGIGDVDEVLTGEHDLASEEVSMGNLLSLKMSGVGVTATAITGLVDGGLRTIDILNRGAGYTAVPKIGISTNYASGGFSASAFAEMIGGIVVCNDNTNPNAKSVQRALITNPGYGYTSTPGVRFITENGRGSGAIGKAEIANGTLGIITVTNSGGGYVNAPTVTITGISTMITGVAATAVVSAAGSITAIYVTNGGIAFESTPTITIEDPPLDSTGDFVFNDLVRGSISGTTGRVKDWNSTTNILKLSNITGDFVMEENIVGTSSSATHYITAIDDDPEDGFATNDEIELEADNIIDFSEGNPFGMP